MSLSLIDPTGWRRTQRSGPEAGMAHRDDKESSPRHLNLDVGRHGANQEFTHLLNHTLKFAMVKLTFIKAWAKI